MKLGLLASGDLGYHILQYLYLNYEICFVLTDKKSNKIIDFVQCNNIPFFIGNPRGGKAKDFISGIIVDVIISVNYLFIIEDDIIQHPSKIAFNIHGSLLPKYRGRTPHVWAIINNETETGITAHVISKECDAGDIIHQIKVPIHEFDTGYHILKKFEPLYIDSIDTVLSKIKTGTLTFISQDHSKATFFGKRTPEDGKIDWNWQKERIRNWVRAQSYPYPGAYTYYNQKKFIIDEVVYDELGYRYDIINGLILSVDPIMVKTPNGVLRITKYRDFDIEIKEGSIFK